MGCGMCGCTVGVAVCGVVCGFQCVCGVVCDLHCVCGMAYGLQCVCCVVLC